ncbi:hypothetical protein BU15DRAFT_73820 [Melanogaster broomeanus]|nr:hypothetical protein BU15DRAFT_73820 [Melanogaster broomeanus]
MFESAYAASPFDHAKADIILRTSDNIDFRVFKLFLSLASPFFETLFDIPQPIEASDEQEIKDGLAVIPAAKKYSIDAIERKVGQAVSNPKILEVDPLRCFAIAHHGQLRDETLLAAKYTLRQPLIPPWFEEIELLSAADLLALLTYHHKCGNAAYALKTDVSWIRTHYESEAACSWLSGRMDDHYRRDCGCPRLPVLTYSLFFNQTLQWWNDFMEKTFLALRDKPCEATIQACAEETVQSVRARNCTACSPRIVEGMRDFSALFARKVEEAVSQVELELQF